jgi:hypothetical protein
MKNFNRLLLIYNILRMFQSEPEKRGNSINILAEIEDMIKI